MIGQAGGLDSPEAAPAFIPVFLFTPCGRGREKTPRGPPEQTPESSLQQSRVS